MSPYFPSQNSLKISTLCFSSGEFVTLPSVNSASASIPQTFSPTVRITPERAAPTPSPLQFSRATSVEPNAPIKRGILRRIPPTVVSMSTFGNKARSESASIPSAPIRPAWMLKWDQSKPKSFRAPDVLNPKYVGSG